MTITPLNLRTNNMFWTNFTLSLKQNKKILVVISILQLLGLPLLSVLLTAVAIKEDSMSTISIGFFALISIFCIAVSILCGVIIAVNNFSYLYKKSQVDMIYSLPIKRKYKFISDFFSGLAVYLVPYIAACILSIGILLASGVCIDNMSDIFEDTTFIALIIQGEFAGMLVMTLLYTLTVLVLNCCGTLFESIINILIINILIPGVIAVVSAMFFADLYGISIFDTILPTLGYTSPIGAGIYLIALLAENNAAGCLAAGVFGKWIVFFLLFTAAVFTLSMFLYLKRKAEDVSKPYVYKFLYYFVITAIAMAISLIARYDITTIVPVIVFSLIVYLIFEVVTNRGFKKIYKSLIRYAVTMVAILIICIVSVGTKGFGVESKVPSASSVKSVTVSYWGFDLSVDQEHLYYSNENGITYNQKDIIEKIIEVHEDVLDLYYSDAFESSYFSDDYYYIDYYDSETYYDGTPKRDYPRYNIEFKYKLKTGSTIDRIYDLTFEQIQKLFILDSTPQMGEFLSKFLMDDMSQKSYVNNTKKVKYIINISNMLNTYNEETEISHSQYKEISEAYGKDYSSMTESQMLTDKIYCYINDLFPVRESFKNTIACLEKYNITVPAITDSDYAITAMYPPEALQCWGADVVSASFGTMYLDKSYGRLLSFEQFESLIELGMVRAPYYEEADCYCITYNDNVYIIPSKFSDMAKNLYDKLNETNVVISKESLINKLRVGESISNIIEEWEIDYNANLYNELVILQDLAFSYYDEYQTFDEYYDAYFGYDNTSLYNSEKLRWDNWQYFNKFYGYASAEDYISYHADEDKDTIETQWDAYSKIFPELIKQLNN